MTLISTDNQQNTQPRAAVPLHFLRLFQGTILVWPRIFGMSVGCRETAAEQVLQPRVNQCVRMSEKRARVQDDALKSGMLLCDSVGGRNRRFINQRLYKLMTLTTELH
jgi:hypothetical protein